MNTFFCINRTKKNLFILQAHWLRFMLRADYAITCLRKEICLECRMKSGLVFGNNRKIYSNFIPSQTCWKVYHIYVTVANNFIQKLSSSRGTTSPVIAWKFFGVQLHWATLFCIKVSAQCSPVIVFRKRGRYCSTCITNSLIQLTFIPLTLDKPEKKKKNEIKIARSLRT